VTAWCGGRNVTKKRDLDTELEKNQMPDKPKPKPKTKKGSENSLATPIPQKSSPEKQSLNIQSAVARNIPLMFQAQIPDRGNIQYVGEDKKNKKQEGEPEKPAYERWVMQWLDGCPPKPEKVDESQPVWMRKPVQPTVKLPEFGAHVKTWKYQIRWRMVTNGGQDEGIIRPVIGAKGMPFFPGSSMKGAFRNACRDEDKCQRYCGGEITVKGEKRTKPGILRFHGGYPVDMSWAQRDRLVDIAHGQQPYQVMRDTKERGENANVQISLYQPQFKFGISSTQTLTPAEWQEIQEIWEKALGYGIGSRVSAGYGYVNRINQNGSVEPIENRDRTLVSIHLNGQGLTSQLLLKRDEGDRHKTPEFRPNMFKATLRGHTLRLLGGIADEKTARDLTKEIWGGFPDKGESGEAIVGRVGINFTVEGNLHEGEHTYNNKRVVMPTYELEDGRLDLLQMGEVKPELEKFLASLVKFSFLLGGFGKSWRRVDHQLFYPSYFQHDDKAMIGCHWELATPSEKYYITAAKSDLSNITKFLNEIREQAIAWVESEGYQANSYVQDWREAWHPNKVQVWGRFAKNEQSRAVHWFHRAYQDNQSIKASILTGWSGRNDRQPKTQIGRIWHRMYPRYVIKDGKLTRLEKEYVELLTIFPDESNQSQQFLHFLPTKNSGFKPIW
jgi:CRISPR-associated protein Cmr6